MNLQVVPSFVVKVSQLFNTLNVRFGVMIVGPTGGGKTECYRVLQRALSTGKSGQVKAKCLNPKSVSMGQLYGQDDPNTKEWTDGLASSIIRNFTNKEENRN